MGVPVHHAVQLQHHQVLISAITKCAEKRLPPLVTNFLYRCSPCASRTEKGESTDIRSTVCGLVWIQHFLQHVSLKLQQARMDPAKTQESYRADTTSKC